MGNAQSGENSGSLITGLFRAIYGDYNEALWPPRYSELTHHWCLDGESGKESTLHFCHDSTPGSPEHDPEFDYTVFNCQSAKCQTCVDVDILLYPSRDRWRGSSTLKKDPKSREIHCTWGLLTKSKDDGCEVCGILVEGILHFHDGVRELTEASVFCIELLEEFTVRVTSERLPAGDSLETVDKFSVEFHTDVDTGRDISAIPWKAFGSTNVLKRDIGFSDCVAFVQERVKECLHHSKCLSQTASKLPTRLIDVGHGDDDIRLEVHPKQGELYTTLSHVWGSTPIPMTTTSNLQDQCNNIPWSTLTQTFQDAISVTRELGLRYLWIDSICIIQDSEADWKTEAAQMAKVYMGSYLNLAATSQYDTSSGLIRPRFTRNERREEVDIEEHEIVRASSSTGQEYSIYARRALKRSHFYLLTFDHDIIHSNRAPLLQRAWVLQERLLSARTLHFCFDEMVWECKTDIACECGYGSSASGKAESNGLIGRNVFRDLFNEIQLPNDQQSGGQDVFNHGENFLLAWYRLIEYYVTLNITFPKDRLPALGGLTKILQEKMGWNYLEGLWTHDFMRGALFSVSGSCRRHEGIPTWSWGSLESYSDSIPDEYISFLLVSKDVWSVDSQFRLLDHSGASSKSRDRSLGLDDGKAFVIIEAAFLDATIICEIETPTGGTTEEEVAEEKEAKEGEAKEGEAKEGEAKEGEAKEGEAKEGAAETGTTEKESTEEAAPSLSADPKIVLTKDIETPKAEVVEESIEDLDTQNTPKSETNDTEPDDTSSQPASEENTEPEKPRIITKLLIKDSTDTINVIWDIVDDKSNEKSEISEGEEVLAISLAHYAVEEVMKCHGLVLKARGDGWYQRVGIFSAPDSTVFRGKKEMILR